MNSEMKEVMIIVSWKWYAFLAVNESFWGITYGFYCYEAGIYV